MMNDQSPTAMRRARCSQRGSTMVGFALTFPVLMGAVALGLFADHAYAVKSDLQRTAQEAARYAATRCDPRGTYGAGTNCRGGATYPSSADVASYATSKFTGHSPVVTFDDDCASTSSSAKPGVYCETFDPVLASQPAPNQRVTVTLQYHFSSPISGLLHFIPGAGGFLDLKAAGDAVVE